MPNVKTKKTVKKDLKKYLAVKPPEGKEDLEFATISPDLKKEWCKALRSDKYKQGQEFLCATPVKGKITRYCCLGVLAEILIKKGFPIKKTEECQNKMSRANNYKKICPTSFSYRRESDSRLLPGYLAEDIGIIDQETFSDMNDTQGFSFKQIAAKIEKDQSKPL